MNEVNIKQNTFVGYEYHSIVADKYAAQFYEDGYQNFGWVLERSSVPSPSGTVDMKFKRDRKICNKAELTRLQRQFDACVHEITRLEKSRFASASIAAFTIGIAGTAFIAGATFAYLAGMIPITIILAIPGFIGWVLPYFSYHHLLQKNGIKITPLVEHKHDELYDVCEKASTLL